MNEEYGAKQNINNVAKSPTRSARHIRSAEKSRKYNACVWEGRGGKAYVARVLLAVVGVRLDRVRVREADGGGVRVVVARRGRRRRRAHVLHHVLVLVERAARRRGRARPRRRAPHRHAQAAQLRRRRHRAEQQAIQTRWHRYKSTR